MGKGGVENPKKMPTSVTARRVPSTKHCGTFNSICKAKAACKKGSVFATHIFWPLVVSWGFACH